MMAITHLGIEVRRKGGVRWADNPEFFLSALPELITAVMQCSLSKRQT